MQCLKGAPVAGHDNGYKRKNLVMALCRMEQSPGPDDMGRVIMVLRQWLAKPEQADLRRAFVTVLEKRILPARMPGTKIPQIEDLEEAQLMLAEHVNDWTQTWKQEGVREGIEEARSVLLNQLEKRFGPLPADARLCVQALNSFKDLMELSARIGAAPSLADLGLAGDNA